MVCTDLLVYLLMLVDFFSTLFPSLSFAQTSRERTRGGCGPIFGHDLQTIDVLTMLTLSYFIPGPSWGAIQTRLPFHRRKRLELVQWEPRRRTIPMPGVR
uniref:Putative secreted peptide n=1 Tax=Anopheles braziliensis TaxID=58242 RepID=A0A2M3ZTX2_9DIPT